MEVAWHASLYGSSNFIDVALRLEDDGSIVVKWDRIVLDGGGSLQHGLLSCLGFDELPALARIPSADIPVLTVGGGRGSIVRTVDGGINTTCGIFYGADRSARDWTLRAIPFTLSTWAVRTQYELVMHYFLVCRMHPECTCRPTK